MSLQPDPPGEGITDAPHLDCPACDSPAIEAEPCDECGTEECPCIGTGWVFFEQLVRCWDCGEALEVRCDYDDGIARVSVVEDADLLWPDSVDGPAAPVWADPVCDALGPKSPWPEMLQWSIAMSGAALQAHERGDAAATASFSAWAIHAAFENLKQERFFRG